MSMENYSAAVTEFTRVISNMSSTISVVEQDNTVFSLRVDDAPTRRVTRATRTTGAENPPPSWLISSFRHRAYARRAQCFKFLGQTGDYKADMLYLASLPSAPWQVYHELGNLHLDLYEFEDAITAFGMGIVVAEAEEDPEGKCQCLDGRSWAYFNLGRFQAAQADSTACLLGSASRSPNPITLFRRGAINLALGFPLRALPDLLRAAEGTSRVVTEESQKRRAREHALHAIAKEKEAALGFDSDQYGSPMIGGAGGAFSAIATGANANATGIGPGTLTAPGTGGAGASGVSNEDRSVHLDGPPTGVAVELATLLGETSPAAPTLIRAALEKPSHAHYLAQAGGSITNDMILRMSTGVGPVATSLLASGLAAMAAPASYTLGETDSDTYSDAQRESQILVPKELRRNTLRNRNQPHPSTARIPNPYRRAGAYSALYAATPGAGTAGGGGATPWGVPPGSSPVSGRPSPEGGVDFLGEGDLPAATPGAGGGYGADTEGEGYLTDANSDGESVWGTRTRGGSMGGTGTWAGASAYGGTRAGGNTPRGPHRMAAARNLTRQSTRQRRERSLEGLYEEVPLWAKERVWPEKVAGIPTPSQAESARSIALIQTLLGVCYEQLAANVGAPLPKGHIPLRLLSAGGARRLRKNGTLDMDYFVTPPAASGAALVQSNTPSVQTPPGPPLFAQPSESASSRAFLKRAMTHYTLATQAWPNYVPAQYRLGLLSLLHGDVSTAETIFLQILHSSEPVVGSIQYFTAPSTHPKKLYTASHTVVESQNQKSGPFAGRRGSLFRNQGRRKSLSLASLKEVVAASAVGTSALSVSDPNSKNPKPVALSSGLAMLGRRQSIMTQQSITVAPTGTNSARSGATQGGNTATMPSRPTSPVPELVDLAEISSSVVSVDQLWQPGLTSRAIPVLNLETLQILPLVHPLELHSYLPSNKENTKDPLSTTSLSIRAPNNKGEDPAINAADLDVALITSEQCREWAKSCVLFLLGVCRMVQHQLTDAIYNFTLVLEADPDSPLGHVTKYFRAICHFAQKRVKRAIKDVSEAVDNGHCTALAMNVKGRLHLYTGSLEAAVQYFTQAIQIEEKELGTLPPATRSDASLLRLVNYYIHRSTTYLSTGSVKLAILDLTSALYWKNEDLALLPVNEVSQKFIDLEKNLETPPNAPPTVHGLSRKYATHISTRELASMGVFGSSTPQQPQKYPFDSLLKPECAKNFSPEISIMNELHLTSLPGRNVAQIYALLGTTYVVQNEIELGIQAYSRAIALSQLSPTVLAMVYYNLGCAYANNDNWPLAIKHFTLCLHLLHPYCGIPHWLVARRTLELHVLHTVSNTSAHSDPNPNPNPSGTKSSPLPATAPGHSSSPSQPTAPHAGSSASNHFSDTPVFSSPRLAPCTPRVPLREAPTTRRPPAFSYGELHREGLCEREPDAPDAIADTKARTISDVSAYLDTSQSAPSLARIIGALNLSNRPMDPTHMTSFGSDSGGDGKDMDEFQLTQCAQAPTEFTMPPVLQMSVSNAANVLERNKPPQQKPPQVANQLIRHSINEKTITTLGRPKPGGGNNSNTVASSEKSTLEKGGSSTNSSINASGIASGSGGGAGTKSTAKGGGIPRPKDPKDKGASASDSSNATKASGPGVVTAAKGGDTILEASFRNVTDSLFGGGSDTYTQTHRQQQVLLHNSSLQRNKERELAYQQRLLSAKHFCDVHDVYGSAWQRFCKEIRVLNKHYPYDLVMLRNKALHERAKALQMTNCPLQALVDFDIFLACHPSSVHGFVRRAMCHRVLRHYTCAAEDILQAQVLTDQLIATAAQTLAQSKDENVHTPVLYSLPAQALLSAAPANAFSAKTATKGPQPPSATKTTVKPRNYELPKIGRLTPGTDGYPLQDLNPDYLQSQRDFGHQNGNSVRNMMHPSPYMVYPDASRPGTATGARKGTGKASRPTTPIVTAGSAALAALAARSTAASSTSSALASLSSNTASSASSASAAGVHSTHFPSPVKSAAKLELEEYRKLQSTVQNIAKCLNMTDIKSAVLCGADEEPELPLFVE